MLRSKPLILTAAAAALALGAVVAGPSAFARADQVVRNTDATTRACFDTNRMEGYAPMPLGERDGINIKVALDGVYQLEFAAPCPSVKDADGVAIRTRNGSRRLCSGGEADLTVHGAQTPPYACAVSGMRKLSVEEVAALPRANRP